MYKLQATLKLRALTAKYLWDVDGHTERSNTVQHASVQHRSTKHMRKCTKNNATKPTQSWRHLFRVKSTNCRNQHTFSCGLLIREIGSRVLALQQYKCSVGNERVAQLRASYQLELRRKSREKTEINKNLFLEFECVHRCLAVHGFSSGSMIWK